MSGMSTPYESGGRTAQKRRTRDALIQAAQRLFAAGVTPTVDETARAASVARTTAYRYFRNQRELILAAQPEVGATTMLPQNPPQDSTARLDSVVRNFTAMIADTEAQQRATLRLSLEVDAEPRQLPLRQGRAIAWITEALQGRSGELSDDELNRLVLAVRATIGIEALVWLVDVSGLSRSEAGDLMRWSAQALLHFAIHEQPPPTDGHQA
jgi:AcrR family transcriptional regulator